MKSPAFQFYPGDYLGSQRVQLMTLEEEGAYVRLLCYCWLHGSIPSDPDKIARLIGKGASTTLATTLATMFSPVGGCLVHDRLESERRKQGEWRRKSSEGGRKSAESKKKTVTQKPANHDRGQGSLPNGSNQTSTLQSSVFSLPSSVSGSRNNTSPPAAPPDGRHHEITQRWGDAYRVAFEMTYMFATKDAATLKRFLTGTKDSADEILSVASQAWARNRSDRFAKRCKEAATIHGLCTFYNDIRVELQAPMPLGADGVIGKRSSMAG